jgi:outer membrane protein OmpA-like peptidoglycan-associated protein
MENIMETAHNALTGDAVARLSSQIDETPTATERGLACAMPVSIAGLAMVASSERSAGELLRALRGGDYPHVAADELSPVVSDPGETDRLAQSGQGILGRIFGARFDGIVDALAGQTGVKRASAIKLLGLSAPLVLDVVGKRAQAEPLDANGLSRFLDDQSRTAAGILPGPVSTALAEARQAVPPQRVSEPSSERPEWRPGERRGMAEQARLRAGNVGDRVGEVREDPRARAHRTDLDDERRHLSAAEAVTHERKQSRGWMWLLAAIVLIGVLALLVARARRTGETPIPDTGVQGLEAPRTPPVTVPGLPQRREAVPPATPPAAEESPPAATAESESPIAPPEAKLGEEPSQPPVDTEAAELDVLTASSGADPLTSFLESTAPPPKRFVLGMIEFDSGASNVPNTTALDAVADALKNHPGAQVRIDGYADPAGSTASNQALSQARAREVKKYLVERGVPTERIEAAGKGETAEGGTDQPSAEMAKARRVELVVLTH